MGIESFGNNISNIVDYVYNVSSSDTLWCHSIIEIINKYNNHELNEDDIKQLSEKLPFPAKIFLDSLKNRDKRSNL